MARDASQTEPGGTVTKLKEHLSARVAAAGPISVAEFMATALTHPRYGYYMQGDPFGRHGDFITAPEISQMFGELIGLWCVATWRQLGEPCPFRLVEIGPGRGSLMADALRAIGAVPACRAAAELDLVETSPALRQQQRDTLRGALARWHDRLAQVPGGPFLLIANELFDALPVRQFELTSSGWFERMITVDDETGEFTFVLAPGCSLAAGLSPLEAMGAPKGTICQVSTVAMSLADEIARRAVNENGVALIIDYGPAVSESGACLRAVHAHGAHDPLTDPGMADLSADVDFMVLGRTVRAAGARGFGPVGQGAFLRALGIESRANALIEAATPSQRQDIESALKRLIEPDQMGERFKAFAVSRANHPPPAGFEGKG